MTAHAHDLSPWQHDHDYAPGRANNERRVRWVVAVTLSMMVLEIGAGWLWNSMALLADGWHMGTHAAALGVTALSYALARRWARDARFSLGTGKVEVLGAYTSALLLAVVAIGIAWESVQRWMEPRPIAYTESLAVAVLGLIVNVGCAWLLRGEHDHAHHHDGSDHHDDDHEDLNLRAAYLHVLADAATSVLAIAALVAGLRFGWSWADAAVGLLGALLIGHWSRGLLRQSAAVLLDREMDHPLARQLRDRIESDGDARIADLHLSRVGGQRFAAQLTIVATIPLEPDGYRERLAELDELAHVSIEVHRCPACGS